MTIQIKHAFTSAKGDGGDATLVRPSNWNALHTTSMATGNLLGRLTAGAGSFEEIPLSALVAGALDETTGAAFLAALGLGGFESGDVKYSLNPTATAGWVAVTSASTTLGKVGSGATYAAADAQTLYEIVWNAVSNTYAAVSGGRGASATADFTAGKTLTLPWFPGRAIIGAGSGGILTTRVQGENGGAETVTLTTNEMPSHYHVAGIYDPTHAHSTNAVLNSFGGGITGGGAFQVNAYGSGATISAAATGVRVNSPNGIDTTYSTGNSGAHVNMQPWVALTLKVKL